MPRDGATTFGDLVAQLKKLRVECNKFGHPGRTSDRRAWR